MTADDTTFWAQARAGRLVFQHCAGCGYVRWPAAGVCPQCLGRGYEWKPVQPVGTVWSYAVYHRAYSAALKDAVPYNVALVELACGVRLLTRLVGEPAVGSRVEARFEEIGEHGVVPVFAPPPATA
ncbi:Zn-ribbon domain-containing OB-fold protein [Phytohabitans suffuscus]|uniref:DNA-binding protein n=1 Tax=Phytohabitans suffuscus TaxID=624315 RepID=A0A6F8YUM0_9ACTN|nr:OB-fold domain-containing protein [Phytohabitans suffuscus]BCB89850.1 hypothetical protein Psuf_071630 [Phytohabitans suffuscus]